MQATYGASPQTDVSAAASQSRAQTLALRYDQLVGARSRIFGAAMKTLRPLHAPLKSEFGVTPRGVRLSAGCKPVRVFGSGLKVNSQKLHLPTLEPSLEVS